LHGNGPAARAGDFGDDFVRTNFARCIIDDDRRTFRREMLGDGRADALGSARDDRDFACEFFRDVCLICLFFLGLLFLFCYLKSSNKE
jgi:hypothetical protein